MITTLSGLRLGTTKERLREALREAIDRTVETGAVHAELRGRYLLARSYQDWGELDEAERWFRSSVERAESAGIEWAPYASGARWHLTWVLLTRGDWDAVLRLTDLSGSHPPPMARAMFASLRAVVRVARGEDLTDELRGPAADVAARRRPGRARRGPGDPARDPRGDVAAAQASYDHLVGVIGDIWHPWFDGRVRMAALVLEATAAAIPKVSAADRAPLLEAADRLHDDGHTVLERYAEPAKSWGPEGRAWLARLDAELLRVRWLAGADDAPTVEALISGWREVVRLFEEFGDAYELARSQVVLARCCAPPARPPRRVRSATRPRGARRLGATPLVEQLRAIGSAPARHEAGSDVLTPRETEILQHSSRPAGPTARSASSCSSAPRP